MNKIFYTLSFLLFFSFFNNEAKAQTADVVACDKTASGATIISNRLSSSDQTCDTSGATNLTLNIHSLGFCTSAPTINFAANASAADERDNGTEGPSDFSSCRWVITQSTTSAESLESVGAIEPLPNDEIPPPGTYTHAVLVISNVMTITGSVTFDRTIKDTTGTATEDAEVDLGLTGNSGTTCWTNGTYFVDTGKQGPLLGTDTANAAEKKDAGTYKGGATCGPTPSPLPNTVVSYYANYEPDDEDDPCFGVLEGSSIRGCNTTRSVEDTAFGRLTLYYTVASSLGTANPDIRRARIVSAGSLHGTASNTNTLTAVFAYNTPMVVTDKTTGMEIFVNFSNALNVDFEPIGIATVSDPSGITNTSSTNPPRIRSIQSGPFGIQFRSVEGGGTE
jgi:hypothetical protein